METDKWLGLEKLSRSKSLSEKELFGCAIASVELKGQKNLG